MAMRIDCVHRKFDRPIFGQQANQATGFEIVMDHEAGGEKDGVTIQRRGA